MMIIVLMVWWLLGVVQAVQQIGGGVELGGVEQLAGQYPGSGGDRYAGGTTWHHQTGVIKKD